MLQPYTRFWPSLVLPCGCGRQFDWCAGWQEDPWSVAAHLQGLAWTGVESPTPELQPYSSPTKI